MNGDIRALLAAVEARGMRIAATAVRTATIAMAARIAPTVPTGLHVTVTPDSLAIAGRGARRRMIDSGRWEAMRR